jgi:hypothetical protein
MAVVDESVVVGPQAGRVLTWKIAMQGPEVTASLTIKIDGVQTSSGFFVDESVIPP